MRSDTLAAARAALADLDAAAARVQALFDDASAEAYARGGWPASRDLDHLDSIYDAAARAASAASALRAVAG